MFELLAWLKAQKTGFRLEYDENYGADNRSGWTIVQGGRVVVELEPQLEDAILKAYMEEQRADWETDEHETDDEAPGP